MPWKNHFTFISHNKLLSLLIFISGISALRTLFLPISGDEITYSRIAENIITQGQYFFSGKPSTITPTLPFIISLFHIPANPVVGFLLAKLTNLLFIFIGLRYLLYFFKNLGLKKEILWSLLLLTIVNTNFVLGSIPLYPEALLFCCTWIFIYHLNKKYQGPKDVILLLVPFVVLVLTRYLFAVFGALIIWSLWPYLKKLVLEKKFSEMWKVLMYSLLCFLPLLLWFKYVFHVEQNTDLSLSYFNRFKHQEIWYNIKAGLGLIQHAEVGNINGIPAFITLFLPITGFRNWILSIILILAFILGYFSKLKDPAYQKVFAAILLIMAGLVFAGTGFSRYWLPMLPGFLLGFYLFFSSIKFKDDTFILLAKIAAVVYVINGIRLDVKVLTNFL